MHKQTYDIDNFPSQEEANAQGYTIALTTIEKRKLLGFSKAERAAWANERAKAKKRRNSAKRARRANR